MGQILVQAGVDKDAQDNDGSTSLHVADQYGHNDCVQVLLQSPHISAKHASITVSQDSPPVLEDSSSNGCTVFGPGGSQRKVKKNRSPLAEGD